MGSNKDSQKKFMSYTQQIELLKRKNLAIADENYAVDLLKEHSYFGLISGYKKPFKDKNGNYKLHVSINDIYSLYVFDDNLRYIFLKYILKIEKHIKSLLSYSFCEEHGANESEYLNANNYNNTNKNNAGITKLIDMLSGIAKNSNQYTYINHQKTKHNNVPLWASIKAFTLGSVSKMYCFLPQRMQIKISKEFNYVHEEMLGTMLEFLSHIRNICAHNERLYDFRYDKKSIDDTQLHSFLNIKKMNNRYIKGKNDVFAVLVILKHLLNKQDFAEFYYEFNDNLESFLKKTKHIDKNKIFKLMGFPQNWNIIAENLCVIEGLAKA